MAAITVARDAQHALQLANDSEFGLSATVWSGNEALAQELAEQLETGAVFINGNGASDPRVAIGGVKKAAMAANSPASVFTSSVTSRRCGKIVANHTGARDTVRPDFRKSSLCRRRILILAAGLGSRFRQAGGTGHKLLAPYPDDNGVPQPLLKLTLQQAQRSGLPLLLVHRPDDHPFSNRHSSAVWRAALLPAPAAVKALPLAWATAHWHGWLIVPGDMAWVRAEDHQCVAQALRNGAPQVRLSWQNQPGHRWDLPRTRRSLNCRATGARALLDPAILITLPAHQGTIRDADLPRSDG